MSAEPQRYYHGGAPNIRQLILPSVETGAPSLAAFGGHGVTRRDRVYVVTDYQHALFYAAFHPSGQGMVYEVDPLGPLEPDPDFLEHGDGIHSYQCERAAVLARHKLKAHEVRAIRAAFGVQP